jgi:hypothetical protein
MNKQVQILKHLPVLERIAAVPGRIAKNPNFRPHTARDQVPGNYQAIASIVARAAQDQNVLPREIRTCTF